MLSSLLLVAAVAVQPLRDLPCMRSEFNDKGELILPSQATEVSAPEDVDENLGHVDQLYPGFDTSTEEFYENLDVVSDGCEPSIGGTVPPDTIDLHADGISDPQAAADQFNAATAAVDQHITNDHTKLPRIVPKGFHYKPPKLCNGVRCGLYPEDPFHGADIIYVRGLDSDSIRDIIAGVHRPKWPAQKAAFTNSGGYWKTLAEQYWSTHINQFLNARQAHNRYLIVAWSDAQRVRVAAHAMLQEISLAMTTRKGVVYKPNDPRKDYGFCATKCVIISHSTGALISNVAMSLAVDPFINIVWGAVAFIPMQTRVHISLGGAIAGSQWATMVLGAALVGSTSPAVCVGANLYLKRPWSTPCLNFLSTFGSVLLDLHPTTALVRWGPIINQTPVPTITIAGGNDDYLFPFKIFFQSGFDDGVVTNDSACGRIVPRPSWPAGFVTLLGPLHPKLFDLGMYITDNQHGRAVEVFTEQAAEFAYSMVPAPRAASACTASKTPWGMLEPRPRIPVIVSFIYYANHYPFVQTTEDHIGDLRDRARPLREDARAIRNRDLYTRNLIKPVVAVMQTERYKGRRIRFRLFGKNRYMWIWRRTYHQLDTWQTRAAADYAYDFIN